MPQNQSTSHIPTYFTNSFDIHASFVSCKYEKLILGVGFGMEERGRETGRERERERESELDLVICYNAK